MDFVPTPDELKSMFIMWYNSNVADYDVSGLDDAEVYIVWYCYVLQSAKCLISTTRMDHMYYEVTYNKDKAELYIDSYKKVRNEVITF